MAGARVEAVTCPTCEQQVRVDPANLAGIPAPSGDPLHSVMAVALDRARKSCPGHSVIRVDGDDVPEDVAALLDEFAELLTRPMEIRRTRDYPVGGPGCPGCKPEGFIPVPGPMTAEQAAQFEAEFKALISDPSLRHQVRLLPSGKPFGPVTHIAGSQVQVGSRLRQRCSWCSVILADYDLTRIAVPEGQDPRPAMWETGALVRVDGRASFIVEHEDGADLPGDSCAVMEIDALKGT